jgi:hypothetical protein
MGDSHYDLLRPKKKYSNVKQKKHKVILLYNLKNHKTRWCTLWTDGPLVSNFWWTGSGCWSWTLFISTPVFVGVNFPPSFLYARSYGVGKIFFRKMYLTCISCTTVLNAYI